MAALVTELGYPWYAGMLQDEGIVTVGDVLNKVGLNAVEGGERAPTPDVENDGEKARPSLEPSASRNSVASLDESPTKEELSVFVSAYLVSLGFTETHATEIKEEIVSKTEDHFTTRSNEQSSQKRVLSQDRLFQFDTLDGMAEFTETFEDSIKDEDDSGDDEEHRGPSEAERRTVRAAVAASKARVASRRASRVSRESGCSVSPTTSLNDHFRSMETSQTNSDSHVSFEYPPYPDGPRSRSSSESLSRESSGKGLSRRTSLDHYAIPGGSRRTSLDITGEAGFAPISETKAITPPVASSVAPAAVTQGRVRIGAAGGLYDPQFLNAVKPLYALHMGAENLGPTLYSLVRFTKPARVLEVGAGYTSAFLLQALNDNAIELETYRKLRHDGLAMCGDAPWSVDAFFDHTVGDNTSGRYRGGSVAGGSVGGAGGGITSIPRTTIDRATNPLGYASSLLFTTASAPVPPQPPVPGSEDARVASGILHCIDNMVHAHTTAHVVTEVARKMGCASRLKLHQADAFNSDLPSLLEPGVEFDLLWIDLGAAHRIEAFMENWWPRVRPEGGHVIVHSTLTNALSRGWLEKMRDLSRSSEPSLYGKFEIISFLEPHKMFQNSITIFQKRGGMFGEEYHEPVHTKFP